MSLNIGDLKYLVSNKIHIDSYESKMGKDADIITFSFKVKYRDPAEDLTNFFEKGYSWILDADVSSGSMEQGGWLVFVEVVRRPSVPGKIIELLHDLKSITGNPVEEYRFVYRNSYSKKYQPLTLENLKAAIPLTPREYRRKNRSPELQQMIDSAGIKEFNEKPKKKRYSSDVEKFVAPGNYR
jgi:hypothetical protein